MRWPRRRSCETFLRRCWAAAPLLLPLLETVADAHAVAGAFAAQAGKALHAGEHANAFAAHALHRLDAVGGGHARHLAGHLADHVELLDQAADVVLLCA